MTKIYKHCVKDFPNIGDETCLTWREWAKLNGKLDNTVLRSRYKADKEGRASYTDRQIAGIDLINRELNKSEKTKTKLPPGAQVCIDSIFYKIGLHNLPFMLIDGDWVRSGKEVHEIRALML